MAGYYQRNHLQDSGSDDSEDRERLERCEATAERYFRDATKEPLQKRTQTFVDLQPYWNTPKYRRLFDAASHEYQIAVTPARQLYLRTLAELELTGEVSEALSSEWDRLKAQVFEASVEAEDLLDEIQLAMAAE